MTMPIHYSKGRFGEAVFVVIKIAGTTRYFM